MAGLAAAAANGVGVVGVAPGCRIVPLKGTGSAHTNLEFADMFAWAALHADVISCSWETSPSNVVSEAIRDVVAQGRGGRGAVVLAASGNDVPGRGRVTYPARLSEVIAVGSSTCRDTRASDSQYGRGLDLLAPGGHQGLVPPLSRLMLTTDISGSAGMSNADYATVFGTSAATAIASGVAALVLSVNYEFTSAEVAQIMCDTATKINPADAGYDSTTGWSERYGYGRVDAAEAVRQAHNAGALTPAHFVAVWEDDHDKNRWHDILARGFTGNGRLRMHTKRVNSVTTGQQHRPAVAST